MRELPGHFEYLGFNDTISPVLHVAQPVYGVVRSGKRWNRVSRLKTTWRRWAKIKYQRLRLALPTREEVFSSSTS